MLQKALIGPVGARFIRDVGKARRQLFIWTVNDDNFMKWGIQKQVDGVITDDPKKFKEICDNWDDAEPSARATFSQWRSIIWYWILITIFSIPFKRRFPETAEQFIQSRELRAKATHTLSLAE